jgi:argininosuccinate lyase
MLAEQRLINEDPAGRILVALRSIASAGPESLTYSAEAEDAVRAIDALIDNAVWPDSAGGIRLARSLNDLNATVTHIWMRNTVLSILSALLVLRERITETAWQHLTTLMPVHTHAQVAQPSTLAHYLSAILAPLQRDSARLRALFDRVNCSPLGTAAFAASAINIRREQSAKLLGFDGLIENGFDAVAATDHFQEFVSTLDISGGCLSRFIRDLLHWVRTEVGAIQIGADFLQSSTLMPQKENPAVLEHIRARLAELHGTSATMAALIRSTPVGEAADFETDVRRPLLSAAQDYLSAVHLLSAVLTSMRVNRPLLANRAGRYFSTTTDLVDLLAIDFQVPYHHAFAITQQVIRSAVERGLDTMDLTPELIDQAALRVIGEEIGIEAETLNQCLAPRRFVERRSSLGGPAPSAVRAYLERERLARGRDAVWIAETRGRIDRELARLDERAAALEAKARG